MNENKFIGQRAHNRISFPPLTTSCEIRTLTPQSTLTQSYNTLNGEYEPERSSSPTFILPEIRVIDPSGIFPMGGANARLALDSMVWLLDGKDITTKWTAASGSLVNDYEIIKTEDDLRGGLKIYKNIPASEKHSLKFKGKFLDTRTGLVYSVESNEVALSCTEKGSDTIACSIDKGEIVYDPFYDKLLLYQYRAANGISNGSLTEADAIADGKSWKQTVNISVTDGMKTCTALPSGVTMRLVRLGTTTALTANTTSTPEIISIAWNKVVFDCRLIDKNEYEVQLLSGGKIIAKAPISISRQLSMPTDASYSHNADITPSIKVFFDSVIMNVGKYIAEHPQLYWLIQWKTIARIVNATTGVWSDGAEKSWQIGERLAVDVAELGIGVSVNDCFFSKWVEVSPHSVCQLLANDDNTILLDDDGSTMLMD
ncbi:MAG: hypothetical protein ACI4T5_09745 [Prevotella sp.]